MVFSGIYPVDSGDYEALKAAMAKLQINDAAFTYMGESSVALGFGFRCGFLGLLHMEIIQERLRREFNMDVISTYPSVIYEVRKTDGEEINVDNPSILPEPQEIDEIREPIVKVPSSATRMSGNFWGSIKGAKYHFALEVTVSLLFSSLTDGMPW